jgi:hypothetical protein
MSLWLFLAGLLVAVIAINVLIVRILRAERHASSARRSGRRR